MRQRLLDSDMRDLIAPDLLADPYPAYEALRGEPVRLRSGTAVVTRHVDAMAVLRGEAFGREPMPPVPGRSFRTFAGIMINQNPPEHTRLRRPVTPLLPPGALDQIERTAFDRTASAVAGARLDVVHDLAVPVAAEVIGVLLGIPQGERARAARWSSRLALAIDSPVPLRGLRLRNVPAILRHQRVGAPTLAAMVRTVRIAERSLAAEHDEPAVIVRTLQDRVVDGSLNQSEATSMWIQLLLAAIDTVQTLLSSTLWLLATHPDQYEALASDPALVPATIEEALRFESPTRLMGRIVLRDVELSGLHLAAGDDVVGDLRRRQPRRRRVRRPAPVRHLPRPHGKAPGLRPRRPLLPRGGDGAGRGGGRAPGPRPVRPRPARGRGRRLAPHLHAPRPRPPPPPPPPLNVRTDGGGLCR